MKANIYRHELLARLRSVVIWSLGITALITFYFAMFPIFSDQAALMNEFLARYPQELQAAFGMDRMDQSTVLCFFPSEGVSMILRMPKRRSP